MPSEENVTNSIRIWNLAGAGLFSFLTLNETKIRCVTFKMFILLGDLIFNEIFIFPRIPFSWKTHRPSQIIPKNFKNEDLMFG